MKIKFIERAKFKLTGRAVPVVKCEDVDITGRVGTLHLLGPVKKRNNSLVETWNTKGWEIDREFGQIRIIDEKGTESFAYVVSEAGVTVPLFTRMFSFPNKEDIIGAAAVLDDVADSMDLHKSMKWLAIGMIAGLPIGAFILGPMLTTMVS